MSESQTIIVESKLDVHTARMQVRKRAREMGFDVTTQARVALATSSLAMALRLGETEQGQVVIDCLDSDEGLGMRVACTTGNVAAFNRQSHPLRDVRWLVDELTVDMLGSDGLQVSLVKWLPKRRGALDEGATILVA
jgi:hypothetical protein